MLRRIDETSNKKKLNVMIYFDKVKAENTQEHNPQCLQIPAHPYRILILIFYYVKDSYKRTYHNLIKKHEKAGLEHFNDPQVFIKNSNVIKDDHKSIEPYNPGKERKALIVFDDIIADMVNSKTFHSIITEIFIRGWETKYFFGFHYTAILSSSKRCKAKHCKPLHHEDSKQTRASTNCP